MEKIIFFLREFWILGLIGIIGGGILVYGLWGVMGEKTTVEIVRGGSQPTGADLLIAVDVAGEVEHPGVYQLPSKSRIGDALVAAGGLALKADREWVAKMLNLAEKVKDGGKIYIPEKSQIVNLPVGKAASQIANLKQNSNFNLININSASASELDSLSGIGAVRAETIIANRPYSDTQELVSKAKIPQSVYEKIKDLVSIY